MTPIPILRRLRAGPRDRRLRTICWVLAIGLLLGWANSLSPFEDVLLQTRNLIRDRTADSQTVVVSIDDRSLAKVAKWPWPRRYHADLIDALNRLGARRIYVDINFYAPSDPVNDRLLAAALARSRAKIALAARYVIDPMTQQRTDFLPLPLFRQHTEAAAIDWEYNRMGAVGRLPLSVVLGGERVPSMSALMAGVSGSDDATYPIDFSINPRTVPTLSAVDLLDGRTTRESVSGKDVIIGAGSQQMGDVWLARGHGMIPGAYFHVVGAQTLRQGPPIEAPWMLPFGLAILLCAGVVRLRRLGVAVAVLSGAIAATLIVPLALEPEHIVIPIATALFALTTVLVNRIWNIYRSSYRLRGTTNIVTGLPNLAGLREDGADTAALIAARIQNYTEISATLAPGLEKSLVDQIVRRLTLGNPQLKIYQGDEGIFAWFLDFDRIEDIGQHLTALAAVLRAPIQVDGHRFDIAISFGVDVDAERSLANRLAGALLAADESAGTNARWKLYKAADIKDAGWRLSLLGQLDAAIDDGSVWVAYQPKLDLATRQLKGAEALVRWTHAEKGLINPMEFIPAAEQSNRIDKLTFHVLDRAVGAAAAINAHGIDFGIAVNVSTRAFDDPNLPARIDEVLARHGLPPKRLTLEVTETAAITEGTALPEILLALRNRGIGISLDDYGTGLSTLEYLRNLPANEIKIDKGFVQSMLSSASDRLMVHSTVQLAHSLGRTVVAEGVEDGATLDSLARIGCDVAQGYLIGRPMTFVALARLLLAERKRLAA